MIKMKLCVATHHRDQIAINAIVISVENTGICAVDMQNTMI